MARTRIPRGGAQRRPSVCLVSVATVALVAAACGTTAKTTTATPVSNGLHKGWTAGITATEIKIGVTFLGTGNGNATDLPDPKVNTYAPQYQAFVDDINASGGVAGRKLVLVWHRYQADSASPDSENQAECSDFTQDRPVFIATDAADSILRQCFGSLGIPQVASQLGVVPQSVYDSDPYLVSTPNLTSTRLAQTEVEALVANNFFSANAKLGVLTFDSPADTEAIDKGLTPALAKHGLTATETLQISIPKKQSDISKILAQIDSAVLKFRDKGIDHVIFLDGPSPAFMIAAEKQQYRPHYAVSTNDWPAYLTDNGVAEAQLRNVVAVGWAPAQDVTDYKDALTSPARHHCLDVLAKRDIAPKSQDDEAEMLFYCDQFRLIKLVLDTAAAPLNGDTFMRAMDDIGTSFQPASSWSAKYAADHRYGAASVRYIRWDGGCSCFAYVGDEIAVQ